MKKFSNYIEEMSMSVTLKPKKNNMFKVTGVGKKMAAHGGIKKGEKFHDSEIDGMHDSGIKVKYQKPKPMKKEYYDMHHGEDPSDATPKAQLEKERSERLKKMMNKDKKPVNKAVKEAIQRRMDRKTIIATDPATGRKVVKVAPKKEVEIGKGKMESVEVNELSSKTMKDYIRKAASPVNKPSAINLASKGGYKLGKSDKYDLDAGEKEDRKAYNRGRGIQRAAKKLYSRTNEDTVNEISNKLKMSYIKKAGQDVSSLEKLKDRKDHVRRVALDRDDKYGQKVVAKKDADKEITKRRKGMRMAVGKLGEDIGQFQSNLNPVNELDTKTLASYQSKAGKQYQQAKRDSDERTAYKPFSVKGGRAADAAEKLKNKRGKGLAQSKKVLDKRYSDKQVKMGKGVAFDKRYKGGNMTGASKAINKIKKGLADHPKVANALRRANEEYKKGE